MSDELVTTVLVNVPGGTPSDVAERVRCVEINYVRAGWDVTSVQRITQDTGAAYRVTAHRWADTDTDSNVDADG